MGSAKPYYALAGAVRRLDALRDGWEGRTTLLSPFDNLIIDRDRTEELFGYFYRMEIYLPPAKRKLGYWAMPAIRRSVKELAEWLGAGKVRWA